MEGRNKILWTFIGFEGLYLACAILHLVVPLTTRASLRRAPMIENVAPDLLLAHTPLTGLPPIFTITTLFTNIPSSLSGQRDPYVRCLPYVPPRHIHPDKPPLVDQPLVGHRDHYFVYPRDRPAHLVRDA